MRATAKRIRRRKRTTSDGSFFKKESQDPGFFSETGPRAFFAPAQLPVQRKCTACEEEHKAKGHALLKGEAAPAEQQEEPLEENDSKAGGKEEEPPCTAGAVDLEAETTADFRKGAGTLVNEKKVKSADCPQCEDDCVDGSGLLSVAFQVKTSVALPQVPQDLTPCQKLRVKTAIDGPLTAHEQKHVAAFETFNGTALLPISYHGCDGGYQAYLETLADKEFQRRQTAANKLSKSLDPFTVPVDLCCKEPKPAKK